MTAAQPWTRRAPTLNPPAGIPAVRVSGGGGASCPPER